MPLPFVPAAGAVEWSHHLVGASLDPLAARTAFGLPMDALAGRVIDLESAAGSELAGLRQELGEAAGVERRFAAVAAALVRRLERGPRVDAAVRMARAELAAGPETPSVAAVAHRLGLSQKTLIARFRRDLGLTPKRWARLFRFRRALAQLEAGRHPDWARLAQETGFYDQAHFANELQAFAGASPEELWRRLGPDGGSLIEAAPAQRAATER